MYTGKISEGYTRSISIDDKLSIHIWVIQPCLFHDQCLVLLLPSKLVSLLVKERAPQVIFHKATGTQLTSHKQDENFKSQHQLQNTTGE